MTAVVTWTEAGAQRQARWLSGQQTPAQVQVVDDTLPANAAYRLACDGTGLLWRSDFQNARQLLQALGRRVDRPPRNPPAPPATPLEAFRRYREAQGRRARVLGKLLIELQGDWAIGLPRAPDLRQACTEAWGPPDGRPALIPLRDLLGAVGAHEWRKKGLEVPALGSPPGNRIHPHYGVFSPVRGEYIDLVAAAALPATGLAFDIGTGTGVLAAVLARRGVRRVIATDREPRALACARDNIARLGLGGQVEVIEADLFPPGRAALVVCNPPWLPAPAASALDHAIYDPDSRMLQGFLDGLAAHLTPGGEGWLILSDLAERLGLRRKGELLQKIQAAGLRVAGRSQARPRHPRAADPGDPLHAARAGEVTSLWRLMAI